MPSSRIRYVANLMVFGGWMLPLVLAHLAPGRLGAIAGDKAARMFEIVGGGWAFMALAYGIVLAMRMRRELAE